MPSECQVTLPHLTETMNSQVGEVCGKTKPVR
jgi:hypothetical protein